MEPGREPRESPEARESGGDAGELGRLGYAQELLRRMGGFSSFAVSFSIISVLTGCITAYADAIGPGGPAALGLGWPLVSVGTMFVALAMAELASAFPTAGALYHWSALLGSAGWGWLTAATNLVGQVAIVAAIDFGCASELAATLGLSGKAPFFLLAAILASHALVNAFSVRLVAWLNDFSATVHILGVVVVVGALLAFGRAQPVSFLAHGGSTTRADASVALGFANGLVLSMFTFTGYDASAHLAEETHDPARRTPWGILTSVGVSAVAGYLLLASITLAIEDLPSVASDRHAALTIMRGALGDGFGRMAMGLAIAAMWFCGLSSVTSASRTMYAFARDRGLPFSSLVARVHPRTRTPIVAIGVATVGPLALVLATAPFSDSLFDAMAKMATMSLYVSYAAPILLGALARRRGAWKTMGPFHLGRFGVLVAWVAVLWSALVLVVCSLPPNQLPAAMLAGALLVLGTLYLTVVRRRFEGPRVKLAALEAKAD
jgi:amino acid transporter